MILLRKGRVKALFWNWRKKIILEKIDSPLGDELAILVRKIEKYAPYEYRTDRADFYYNYGSIGAYVGPLLNLLRILESKRHKKEMDYQFAKELCLKLKDFYDVKDKFSFLDIIRDQRFITKYHQLFKLFYGRFGPSESQIREWITKIKEELLGPTSI